ncbi:MAG: hypothetical protein V6Z89_19410 [Desulfobacter sp.]
MAAVAKAASPREVKTSGFYVMEVFPEYEDIITPFGQKNNKNVKNSQGQMSDTDTPVNP